MSDWIEFVGPNRALALFGVKLVGVNAENGSKLLFSIALVVAILCLGWLLRRMASVFTGDRGARSAFWTRQIITLVSAAIMLIGLASIWFDDPTRLATAMGLISAGLAFALQRAITALAGYFVILRGKTFNVGDRISMGGVRGDVVALGFMQTTIMEMGQPPSVQNADPAMWVKARQYSGRMVTVSNAKIFDEPVYNYTRDFPYIWEELVIPIGYRADYERAEQVLLAAAREHTLPIARLGESAIADLQRHYAVKASELEPRVYLRMTDNWIEMTVRFLVQDHAIRDVKDAMARDILRDFAEAHLEVASATFEIVGLPRLRLCVDAQSPAAS